MSYCRARGMTTGAPSEDVTKGASAAFSARTSTAEQARARMRESIGKGLRVELRKQSGGIQIESLAASQVNAPLQLASKVLVLSSENGSEQRAGHLPGACARRDGGNRH